MGGRVRFVRPDLHSENVIGLQIMGDAQRNWLLGEIGNASSHALVILMLGFPWIGDEKMGSEAWLGHVDERRLISNAISKTYTQGLTGVSAPAAGGYANIIGIAGDAHMLGFDDGTNTDYSTDGNAGFPLVHAAPLHNFGSSKGGPFSHGCFGYLGKMNHQYGSIEISDDGGAGPAAICVTVRLHRAGVGVLLQKEMCGPF